MAHNPPRKLGDCAMLRPCKDAARRLYEITQSQQGFFTTKQAIRGVRGDDTRLPRSSQKLDSRAPWNLPACGFRPEMQGDATCKNHFRRPRRRCREKARSCRRRRTWRAYSATVPFPSLEKLKKISP